jgi:hypothetical protein
MKLVRFHLEMFILEEAEEELFIKQDQVILLKQWWTWRRRYRRNIPFSYSKSNS